MGAGNTPVVLAAFANDPKRYLGKLRKEQKQIRNALRKAERQGQCRLIERPDATVDEILDVFQALRRPRRFRRTAVRIAGRRSADRPCRRDRGVSEPAAQPERQPAERSARPHHMTSDRPF
jgi:hypothetical protein